MSGGLTMGRDVLLAVLELALKYGVPAIIDAVNRSHGNVTVDKVRELESLVRAPDSYDPE